MARKFTDEQVIEALEQHGGNKTRTAKVLGLDVRSFKRRIRLMEETGRINGRIIPSFDEQRRIYQTTTQVDADGNIERQWQRAMSAKREREQEIMRAFVAELAENVPPRKRLKIGGRQFAKELMVGYPIGDHHFGMYAWAAETGANYDLKIAKELLADAVDYLVARSEPAEECLLVNLGDFLHFEDNRQRTFTHGHYLDGDSRFDKVGRTAAFSLCHTVDRLLERHKRVRVVSVPGNHDPHAAGWLTTVLLAYFKKEPRVEVDDSPSMFRFHQFGANMICATHGHTVKLVDLPAKMAALQPEMWGTTKYRTAWTGHVHHGQTYKDEHGAKAESFAVLPPNDAHAAGSGYVASREMHAITFRRSGGELSRVTFNAGFPDANR